MDGNGVGRLWQHGGGIGRWCWEAAFGGGVGRRLKMQRWHWAVTAEEEHAMMALALASSKPRANYYNVVSIC